MRFWVDERASCPRTRVPRVAPGAPHRPRKVLPAARLLAGLWPRKREVTDIPSAVSTRTHRTQARLAPNVRRW